MANQIEFARARSTGLVEVLDRVWHKGLFVGGDIKISLAEVEPLTSIRLIVCSLDKAREIGLDWWMYDRHLSPGRAVLETRGEPEHRVAQLEQQLAARAAADRARAIVTALARAPRRPARSGARPVGASKGHRSK